MVRRVGADVCDVLDIYRHDQTTDDVAMLDVVLTLQADVLAAIRGERPTDRVGELHGLDTDIMRAQNDQRLTPVELLRVLIEYGQNLWTYLLRIGGHPDTPDKRADEE